MGAAKKVCGRFSQDEPCAYDEPMLLRRAFEDLIELIDGRASSRESHYHLERYPELIGPCHEAEPPILLSSVPLGTDLAVEFAFMWSEWWGAEHFWIVQFGPPPYRVFDDNDNFTHEFRHECAYIAACARWARDNRRDLPRLFDRLVEGGVIASRPDSVAFLSTNLIIGRRSENHANHCRYERFHQQVSDAAHAGYHIRSWDGFFDKWVQKTILDGPKHKRVQCARYNAYGFEMIENPPLLLNDDAL